MPEGKPLKALTGSESISTDLSGVRRAVHLPNSVTFLVYAACSTTAGGIGVAANTNSSPWMPMVRAILVIRARRPV